MSALRWILCIAAGGFVINVAEFVVNGLVLGRRWSAITDPLKLAQPGGADVLLYWGIGFAYAAALTWVYGLLQTSEGPGGLTAAKAAGAVLVLGRVLPFFVGLNKHLIPLGFATLWWAMTLIELLVAAVVIGRIANFGASP